MQTNSSAGGDKAVLGSRIRQKTQEYDAFSKACGIRPKTERVRVAGYDGKKAASVRAAMEDLRHATTLNKDYDPIRNVLGKAVDSHPNEVREILDYWDKNGVKYTYRKNAMGYSPGLSAGEHGTIVMDPEASIGAWKHENRHVLDDETNGWAGMRYYDSAAKLIRYEHRGYAEELAIADSLGDKALRRKIIQLRKERDAQIYEAYRMR